MRGTQLATARSKAQMGGEGMWEGPPMGGWVHSTLSHWPKISQLSDFMLGGVQQERGEICIIQWPPDVAQCLKTKRI